jgi:LSD1 subclass zinc finger protein
MELSLEQYAEITAAAIGAEPAQLPAIAAARGVDPQAWQRGKTSWEQRFATSEELARRCRALIREQLAASLADAPPVGLDTYVAIYAELSAQRPQPEILARHGLDLRRFTLASYQWKERFETDARLHAYFDVRVLRAVAELRGKAAFRAHADPGPANRVRARRCHVCGAFKARRPATSYVYCDYCGALFDFDFTVAAADAAATSWEVIEARLREAVARDGARAVDRGDRAAFAEIRAWMYEVQAEACPEHFSPRVRDPDYRRRLVHDALVPWEIATTFDQTHRALTAEYNRASAVADEGGRLASILEALAAGRRLWQHDCALLSAQDLFARHPDGIDAALYLQVHLSDFVRPHLARLGDADQRRLLDEAGLACEWIEAPRVDFSACGCGHCGGRLHKPAGSRRLLCEGCGKLLEVGDRLFSCRGCGAALSLAAGATEVQCGYCDARWVQ